MPEAIVNTIRTLIILEKYLHHILRHRRLYYCMLSSIIFVDLKHIIQLFRI